MALNEPWMIGDTDGGVTVPETHRLAVVGGDVLSPDRELPSPVESAKPINEPDESTAVGEFIRLKEPKRFTTETESDVDRELGDVFKDGYQRLREAAISPSTPKLDSRFPRNHSATTGVPGVSAAPAVGPGDRVICLVDDKSEGTVLEVAGDQAEVLWDTGEKSSQGLGDLQQAASVHTAGRFKMGDRVVVEPRPGYEGSAVDRAGQHGEVVSVGGAMDAYDIRLDSGERLELPADDLRKEGSLQKQAQERYDDVEIVGGELKGMKGMLVSIRGDVGSVQLYKDGYVSEYLPVEVKMSDLRKAGSLRTAAKDKNGREYGVGSWVKTPDGEDARVLQIDGDRVMTRSGPWDTPSKTWGASEVEVEGPSMGIPTGSRRHADLSKTIPEQAAIETTGFPSEQEAGRSFTPDEQQQIQARAGEISKQLGVSAAKVKTAEDEMPEVPVAPEPQPEPSGPKVQQALEFLQQRGYTGDALRSFITIGGGAVGAAKLILGNDVEAKESLDQNAVSSAIWRLMNAVAGQRVGSLKKQADGVGRRFTDEHGNAMMVVKIIEEETYDMATGKVIPTQIEISCPADMATSLMNQQEQVRQDSIALSQHYPVLSSQSFPDEERRKLFASVDDAIVATASNVQEAFRKMRQAAFLEAAHIEKSATSNVDAEGRIVAGSVTWRVHLVAPRFNRRAVVSVQVPIENGEPQDPTEMVLSTGARQPITEEGVLQVMGVYEREWNPFGGRRKPEVVRSFVPD